MTSLHCNFTKLINILESFNTSNQVTQLLISLTYEPYDNITLPNGLTKEFPKLKKLTINHPNFITMDKNQIWPENLTELTIYNSNIDFLPMINNSRIQELTIQSFKNLKTISNIKSLKDLKILRLNSNFALEQLKDDVFKNNKYLRKLNVEQNNIKHLFPSTLAGLSNLEEISIGNNPIQGNWKVIKYDIHLRKSVFFDTSYKSHFELSINPNEII